MTIDDRGSSRTSLRPSSPLPRRSRSGSRAPEASTSAPKEAKGDDSSRPTVVEQDICPKRSLADFQACVSHFKGHCKSRPADLSVSSSDCVAFNCDGTYVACADRGSHAVHAGPIDKTSYKVKQTFLGHGHDDNPVSMQFHPKNPNLMLTAGQSDKTVRVWDLRGANSHTRVQVKELGKITKAQWSPDARYVLVADDSDSMALLDGRNFFSQAMAPSKDGCNDFCFHPSGKFFFMASCNGRVDIYSFPGLKHVKTIPAHTSQAHCNSIAITSDGSTMAVGATDSICSIWDLDKLMCMRNIGRMDWPVKSLAFSYCDQLLAVGTEDHFIDIAYQKTAERVGGHNSRRMLHVGLASQGLSPRLRVQLIRVKRSRMSGEAVRLHEVRKIVDFVVRIKLFVFMCVQREGDSIKQKQLKLTDLFRHRLIRDTCCFRVQFTTLKSTLTMTCPDKSISGVWSYQVICRRLTQRGGSV
ncbi:hypothetical protein L596_016582 [Steinernema carpocapsae]|uniref:Uncharacterized protein n=1 Tax=Steinernema carpocapsae TaxID=34508 RepID=A0A4U5NJL2_STECR|nr:hypothetical protein L596_016582 [Steinernema carpocapsae]